MPIFIYKAKKGPVEIVSDEIGADSQEQAISKLEAMGLSPISVVEKGADSQRAEGKSNFQAGTLSGTGGVRIQVRTQDIDILTRQLASLIKAGVPILRALALICEQTESRSLKRVVNDLESQVRDGKMLSEAMSGYPNVFNNLYLNMIRSGEKGGMLAEVLYKVAEHREKEQEIRHKIQAALAYPLLMIVVGSGTIFIMLTFFLPKFVGLFGNMGQTLPLPTKILINISSFMSGNWYWFLFVLVLGSLIFGKGKTGSKKKLLFDMVKLRLPFIRKFIRNAEIAKFARTLGMLLKNGIPVYESLELATNTLDNEALRRQLSTAGREIVNQGATLSLSLKKINIFPNFAINMIAVGEEGGKLEESLAEIANVYEREVEQAIKIMTSLLEPLLILGVGGVVGFIVFAMLLPIFNIGMMAK